VWSTDVVNYPQSFAAAIAAGFYVANTFPPPVVGFSLSVPPCDTVRAATE
jgi:hypothetical protein